jgi:replication-associated recombination protein RarA
MGKRDRDIDDDYYSPWVTIEPEDLKPFNDLKNLHIETIDDLIKLTTLYVRALKSPKVRIFINELFPQSINDYGNLIAILPYLTELNNMIGLKEFKKTLTLQLLYYLQDLHSGNEMMHIALYGPPGTGKTSVAKILGKIYQKMGILKQDIFKIASRKDFIGRYLGETTKKTVDVLKSCLGGVLFIDEVYSLSNNKHDKIDIYAKECIDTINLFLSEHKGEFICIVAGYKEEVEKNFFEVNQGLNRRFPWKFTMEPYSHEELFNIFKLKINEEYWNYNDNALSANTFNDKELFTDMGGSIEIFITKCKMAHSKNLINSKVKNKLTLSREDVNLALEMMKLDPHYIKQTTKDTSAPIGMYT